MNSITTTITHRIITTLVKAAWQIQSAGERVQGLGERVEAWAGRAAVRRCCVDEVIETVTTQALGR